MFTFIYNDTFVVGFFVALAIAALWLVTRYRGRGKFHRISAPRRVSRYTMRSEDIDKEDFDVIVESLKEQFRQNNIEAIIAIDKGGLMIGTLLAKEMGIMCYPVTINTPASKGNAIELETPTNAASYIGNREKTKFAILVDFDPAEERVKRVLTRIEASFPQKHTCHKAFIAVTRKQLAKLSAARPAPSTRKKLPVFWTIRAPEQGLSFPW